MFRILTTPLEALPVRQEMTNPAAGAYVSFEGWVREQNEGRAVTALEYEAYHTLAEKEGRRILAEARERFSILEARCVHRTGKLEIGEMAVWVGVTARHRGEAFEACEYIINQVKHRVPIWKKETYADGDSGWVNCQHCHDAGEPATVDEAAYYARQAALPELGRTGQALLKESRVLVVGAGGLGSAVLPSLVAAGIGTIGVCDSDRVEVSNLHRQLLYRVDDIQTAKAEAAARHLRQLNPLVTVRPHMLRLDTNNAAALMGDYDWVLDCTDNFETKYALSDAAVRYDKPLIQASIYQYEGQIGVYRPGQASPCLRCLWPEAPEPGSLGVCAESGVLGATASLFGTLQALELIKQLLNLPGRLTGGELLFMDLLSQTTQRLRHVKSPNCPACGSNQVSLSRTPSDPETSAAIVIEPDELSLERLAQFRVWDMREAHEQDGRLVPFNTLALPYSDFLEQPPQLDRAQAYLLVCPYGGRSLHAAKSLHRQGFSQVYSLAGGWPALQKLLNAGQTFQVR